MIMEFRTYTMRPGTRADFVAFFEGEAIPRMRAAGMTVLGQFSSLTDENVFAYARSFDSVEQREQQYRAFYESEDWLGWMIDTAMGREESFIVFLGDSSPTPDPAPGPLSGVHAARFTVASRRGPVTGLGPEAIAVDGLTFVLPPDVRVFHTPTGRGPTPARSIAVDDLRVGDEVLVLGVDTEAGPIARQIVKRPAV